MQFLASEINKHLGAMPQWQKASDGEKGKLLLQAENMISSKFGAINAFSQAQRRAVIIQAGYICFRDDDTFCDDVIKAFGCSKPVDPGAIKIDTSELSRLRLLIGSVRTLAKQIASKSAKAATRIDTEFHVGADVQAKIAQTMVDKKTINTEFAVGASDQIKMAENMSMAVDYSNPLSILMAKVLENLDNASDDITMFLGDKDEEDDN